MTRDERAAAYLAKAREAEEAAETARDEFTRQVWLRIAKSYRDLALVPGRWS